MTKLRLVKRDDVPSVLKIYGDYIRSTVITFEITIPTEEEFWNRIQTVSKTAPWVVAEIEGKIAGYAYAGKHRDREAYQWSVEPSVYLDPNFHKKGIGTLLYKTLFKILRLQGFYNAYAGITLPNDASVRLHESLGFMHLGTYKNIGHKMGQWHDVGWWNLNLQEKHIANPPKPKSPEEIGQEKIEKVLSSQM